LSAARAAGLLLGVAADSVHAGPRRHHPARGRLAGSVERVIARDRPVVNGLRVGLATGGMLLAGIAAERLGRRNPLLQLAGTAVATWAVLGGAAVAAEGAAMARALDAGDLAQARCRLPRLSPCDPEQLDPAGLARAAVESIADSTADAMVGPLLWGAVAGIPGLLAYRAVNTLESSALLPHLPGGRHRWLGWLAARLDDVANLVPSRVAAVLTTVCAPVVGGSAPGAWQVWRRDRALHSSPNAGQVEAAFAGALEIRLGGRAGYPRGGVNRPVLGHGRTPDAGDVTRGVELSRVVGAVAAAGSAVLAAGVGARRRR
jgi:adenosylcobinamide-phosphate synthase